MCVFAKIKQKKVVVQTVLSAGGSIRLSVTENAGHEFLFGKAKD
jgi:hypothetical protein